MVKRILTGAGFVEGKTFKETRFLKPPQTTYAVYTDSYKRRGADSVNLITEHNYTIELYSYKPDPTAEAKIEKMFDTLSIEYEKSERYWLDTESLYQIVYTFYIIEK